RCTQHEDLRSSALSATTRPALYTLSLHDALPISRRALTRHHPELDPPRVGPAAGDRRPGERPPPDRRRLRRQPAPLGAAPPGGQDRKSTRLNSSHVKISYAVFCVQIKSSNKSVTC